MNRMVRHQAWILVAGAVALFTNLGATRLWDQDEAYFAGTASEMFARGQWIVPYFNGELFSHKPPLMFWMMMAGYEMFGVTEFAARLFSAVFGIGTALVTYHFGRRLFTAEVGLWAGLAMTSCLMFDVVARAATPDSFLVFFSTLALYVFVSASPWGRTNPSLDHAVDNDRTPNPNMRPASWMPYILIYAVMGVAVLAKGPIGVLLPMATVGLFLLCTTPRGPLTENPSWLARWRWRLRPFGVRNFLRTTWQMKPLTALIVVMLVAGPWFVMVGLRTDGRFLWEFFGDHNFRRFLKPMENHSGSIFYYIPAILVGFFPWSIFAIAVVIDLVQRIRDRDEEQTGAIFVACWAAVFIGFFSLASTKLPSYVLPAYPALALMTGSFLHRWTTRPEMFHRWCPRLGFGTLGLVGAGLLIGLPVVAAWQVDGQPLLESLGVSAAVNRELPYLGLVGIIPLVGSALCIFFSERGLRRPAVVGLAVTSVIFVTSILGIAALRVDRYQTSADLAGAIGKMNSHRERQIAQYRYFRPSLIYYTQQRVESCRDQQAAVRFLAQSDDAYLITTREHYEQLRTVLPPDVTVLARRPRFPKSGEVLVLGHAKSVARRSLGTSSGL